MLRAFTILLGLILLLPGACALFYMAPVLSHLPDAAHDEFFSVYVVIWGVSFLISGGGLLILRSELRK